MTERIEELKKHCWVDRNGDEQMPLDEVIAILTQLEAERNKAARENEDGTLDYGTKRWIWYKDHEDKLEELKKIAKSVRDKAVRRAVEGERERLRDVVTTRTRKLKIGQNAYARKQLKLTEKQIEDHNNYCEAWEEGYDQAKKDVEEALTPPTSDISSEGNSK